MFFVSAIFFDFFEFSKRLENMSVNVILISCAILGKNVIKFSTAAFPVICSAKENGVAQSSFEEHFDQWNATT